MNAEQIVYLRNKHAKPGKGEDPKTGTLVWQYGGKLYSIEPEQTLPIQYHLATHALKAGPLHSQHLEILDEKLGKEAAIQSASEIAAAKAAEDKAAAQRMIEKAKESEAEAKRLAAVAKANKVE